MKPFRNRLLLILLLLTTPLVMAGYGAGNPRLEKLYAMFLSPCCWQESLTSHRSEIAIELRGQIAAWVRDGRSDDEIKAALVNKYSQRILVIPEGQQRQWLFWTPPIAVVAGFVLLARLMKRAKNPPLPEGTPLAELEENWDAE